MEKADIFRLSESIKGYVNAIERAFNKNIFFTPPHPDIADIRELVNHIINNNDEIAINAIMPLLESKDMIGEYYWNLTNNLLFAPTIDSISQKWNEEHPDSNLKFGGYDNSELCAYAKYLSTLEYELRTLSNWLETREPEKDATATTATQSKFEEYIKIGKKKLLMNALHKYIDGKRGRASILTLYVAIDMRLIEKQLPYKVFIAEFGNIICNSEYSKALNHPKFQSTDIQDMKRKLSGLQQ